MSRAASELRFSTICGLIAGMAMATAAFFDPLPWWMPVPLTALALWRLYPAWQGREAPAVGRAIKYVFLVSMTLLLWFSGRLGLGLDGAGSMFIVLLWSKLLELQGVRDLQRTCAIALFLVSANLLISQSLAQCLFAGLSSLTLLGVLVQRLLSADAPGVTRPGSAYRTWTRSLRVCATVAAQAAPLAVILFVCIPRPALPEGLDRHQARSGISDHLEAGTLSHLALDHGLAFRATFEGGTLPAPEDEYWRGLVLWSTDGESWGRRQPGTHGDPPRDTHRQPAQGRSLSYEITIEPTGENWIFTLDCPVMVNQSSRYEYDQQVGRVWGARARIGSTRLYAATSVLAPASDAPSRYGIDYLAVNDRGERDPRLLALVEELKGKSLGSAGEVDPRLAVAATLDWFRASAFVYTLDPGAMGPHATETFLFEKRVGFCEHYASAFSLLMRLMDVPSRVVVGYLGGEVNPLGGFIDVRNANAHAWSEVWIPDEGWRRVDPTLVVTQVDASGNPVPPDQRFNSAALGASGSHWWTDTVRNLSNRWDYIEAQWDRWALTYDQDTLAALMAVLRLGRLGVLAPLILLVVLVVPLVGALAWIMRRRRRAKTAPARLWQRLALRLERQGLVRGPSEGSVSFALRAGLAYPEHAQGLERFAADHALLHYGPSLPAAARRAVEQRLRRELSMLRFASPPRPAPPPAHRPAPPSTSAPSA